jgi:3-oxoacyl-[acyl-carrier protein] reductase
MTRLKDRVAIITGAARGIGQAIGLRFAQEGAKVAAVDVVEPTETVEKITAAGGAALGLTADVRSNEAAHAAVDRVIETWGQVDILVNNAGVIRDKLLLAMTPDEWETVLRINLDGVYNFCHAVIRPMLSKKRGSIISMSSYSGEHGARGQANYSASKGGINALTKSLASEVGRKNIRVNAIAPGMIETAMSEVVRGFIGDRLKDIIPMARAGRVEEVADLAVFLASDESSYITGQVITIDGGLSVNVAW